MFKTTSLVATVASIAALAATACSGSATPPIAADPSSSSTSQAESTLDTENGGLTNADEQPAFGDPAVAAVEAFDATRADAQDLTVESALAPGARSFHVALLWGHLPLPHDAVDGEAADPKVLNWTGTVSVDAGAIGLKKTLAFDANDKIDPRTDPRVVSFDSHTRPFVDGLFLHVVLPAAGSPLLHFKTASLNYDVDLSLLGADVGGITRLATDSDDGLAFIGYPDVAGCARGLTYGRWVKTHADLGTLRGRVIDDEGDSIGHVRGIWGHAVKADKNVFFGKYIALSGARRGLFGGTYADGEGAGAWVTNADEGTMRLFYSDGYDKADGRGVWLGRWSEKCTK